MERTGAEYRLPLVALEITDEILEHLQRLDELTRQANALLTAARRDDHDNQVLFLNQYHAMEVMGPLNARDGYKAFRAFQETLIARRQSKWDKDSLERLVAAMNSCEFGRYLSRATEQLTKVQRVLCKSNESCERYLREGPPRSEAAD